MKAGRTLMTTVFTASRLARELDQLRPRPPKSRPLRARSSCRPTMFCPKSMRRAPPGLHRVRCGYGWELRRTGGAGAGSRRVLS